MERYVDTPLLIEKFAVAEKAHILKAYTEGIFEHMKIKKLFTKVAMSAIAGLVVVIAVSYLAYLSHKDYEKSVILQAQQRNPTVQEKAYKSILVKKPSTNALAGTVMMLFGIGGVVLFRTRKGKAELETETKYLKEIGESTEALRKSEEELAGIIASMTDRMSMTDEEHNIIWANEVAKDLFGPDLVGKKCYSAYYQYDKPCEPCMARKCFEDGKVHEHETEVIGTDGNRMNFWCIASVTAWHTDGRPKMVTEVCRNITDRKRAEKALRESARRTEIAYNQSIIYARQLNEEIAEHKRTEKALQMRTHDLAKRVKQLNCLYGLSNLVEKQGISFKEILRGTANLISSSSQYPDITCTRIIAEGQEFRTENFRETSWKQASDILVHGERVGSLEVFCLGEKRESDEGLFLKEQRGLYSAVAERLGKIIEHMRAQEALRESEKRYRTLTESVADGVGIFQDRKFMFVNNALRSILGYTVDKLVETDPIVLFRDDYKERFKELFEAFERGIRVESFQAPCICGNGREIWTEWRHSTIEWEGKSAVLVTVRDITETKLHEIATEVEREHLESENIKLKATIKDRYRFGNIVGKSPAMQEVYRLILGTAGSNANVVIYGESGTGKELIARTIHDMSDRHDKAFVPVNCGAVPEALFESEFFGHRKGAFTGAHMDKHGFFDLASGGTLFLDEVAELNPSMQVKLLRAIESREYMPVGGKIKNADVRIVTATNRNLADMVKRGLMREDFFYRIDVISITAPPLRNRREDISLLADHFIKLYGDGNQVANIPGKIMAALYSHHWPGNVRELQNVLERYLTVKRFDIADPPTAQPADKSNVLDIDTGSEQGDWNLRVALKNVEKDLIVKVLTQTHGSKSKASSILGLPRRTLFRKMKQLGLN